MYWAWIVLWVIISCYFIASVGNCIQKELEQRKKENNVTGEKNNNMNEEKYRNVEIGWDKINLKF